MLSSSRVKVDAFTNCARVSLDLQRKSLKPHTTARWQQFPPLPLKVLALVTVDASIIIIFLPIFY